LGQLTPSSYLNLAFDYDGEMMMHVVTLKLAAWLSVIVGFLLFASALRDSVGGNGAALGVFFMFLGINAFNAERISRIEETIKVIKEKA
jgi:hypothetical protein